MKRRNHDPDNDTHAYACDYVGKWITEVSLIKNAGRVIRSFREKKSLLDRIEMQRQKVIILRSEYNNEQVQFVLYTN